MSIRRHSEAQIIEALKQMEAGRKAVEVGREPTNRVQFVLTRTTTWITAHSAGVETEAAQTLAPLPMDWARL